MDTSRQAGTGKKFDVRGLSLCKPSKVAMLRNNATCFTLSTTTYTCVLFCSCSVFAGLLEEVGRHNRDETHSTPLDRLEQGRRSMFEPT